MNKQLVTRKPANTATKVTTGLLALSPVLAFAAPEAPDVSEVVTYLGLAVVAIGSIGAAKMIPAAATWLWSTLTGAVKRG